MVTFRYKGPRKNKPLKIITELGTTQITDISFNVEIKQRPSFLLNGALVGQSVFQVISAHFTRKKTILSTIELIAPRFL